MPGGLRSLSPSPGSLSSVVIVVRVRSLSVQTQGSVQACQATRGAKRSHLPGQGGTSAFCRMTPLGWHSAFWRRDQDLHPLSAP